MRESEECLRKEGRFMVCFCLECFCLFFSFFLVYVCFFVVVFWFMFVFVFLKGSCFVSSTKHALLNGIVLFFLMFFL